MQKHPTDPEIANMDEWLVSWYYAHWLEDQEEEMNKMRDFGVFVGAFSNAEMAKSIRDAENNTYSVSDDDFEGAWEYLKSSNQELESKKTRRRTKNPQM